MSKGVEAEGSLPTTGWRLKMSEVDFAGNNGSETVWPEAGKLVRTL